MSTMKSKPVSAKVAVVLVAVVAVFAASLLCGTQPAWADSVQYVEKSWDGAKVVSTTKTAECTPITNDTENIQGWYYVSGDINNTNRLKVAEGAEANIILMDGSKMLVEKGINVHWTSKLNIYAQQGETGELTCSTTEHYIAAIGSNNNSGPNGPITIHGGKVTANNTLQGYGGNAAGIGAGMTGAGGTITIFGGTIEARGGGGGAGIGGGDAKGAGRDGGTITIYGGDVKAYGGNGGAGIGGGNGGNGGSITIWGGKVHAEGGPHSSNGFSSDSGAGIGSGDDDDTASSGGWISIYGGEVEAVGGPDGAGIGGGDACIGGIIRIYNATVKARGGQHGSGIGGGNNRDSGTIDIGGTAKVEAHAGYDGAGIGGGRDGNGDTINISGGTVTADSSRFTNGSRGSGIGGGAFRSGGTITISGGTVEATSGSSGGSGIGNGNDGKDTATTITLKYTEDSRDISVKANSYRYDDGGTTVTLKMENAFMDKDTREGFAAASYTGNDLNQFKNRTLVRDNTHTITVSETQGGNVVADKSRAEEESTVTLTVAPDDDRVLKPGTLKAVAGGTELTLAKDASEPSKYSFTMPAADVTVTAEFVQKVAVESVSLDKKVITLSVDGTETLAATVSPEDTGAAAVDRTITWKSSDESVATVDGAGKVTAVAPGTTTITVTATNGTEETSDDVTATCTVTVAKPKAAVAKAPTAKAPTYNGKAQELVSAGMARHGTMQYALGTKAKATGSYSTEIPTATNAGAYYVWYKVAGDATHADSAAASVKATVAKASIRAAKVTLSKKSYAYDGNAKKPAVKSVTLNGKKLEADADYAVSYASNKKLGKATVTVAGRGNYKDSAKAAFTIALAKARMSTAAHPKAGAVDVKWAKVAGAKSYQVQWRERGGKWKTATVKGANTTVKGLKYGKFCDFRVRAVAGASKGAWSAERHRWLVNQRGVKAASTKPGSVRVAWSKTPKADAGYLVTVRYAAQGKTVAKLNVAAGKTGATIKGLKPGKTAFVQVRALRQLGDTTYAGALTRSAKSIVKVAGGTAKAKAQSASTQAAAGALTTVSI